MAGKVTWHHIGHASQTSGLSTYRLNKLKRDTHSRIIRPCYTAVLYGHVTPVAVRLQYRRHFPAVLRPGSMAV